MKKRRKMLIALLLMSALAVTGALAGCGKQEQKKPDGGESTEGKQDQGKADEGKPAEKKELTVWAWDVALMQLQEAAEKYEKDHQDVTFKFEEMGTDQIYNKLTTSLATGSGIADIVAIEGDVVIGYADKFPEGFLDLSDSVNKDEFLPAKLAEVTHKGKMHALPWDAGPVALFYRTDYFEQAGVKPEDIKTWDDLIAAGKKIEAACKTPAGAPVKMIPVDPKRANLYSMIRGEFGIGVFDEDGKPMVDDERSIKAMKKAQEIYQSGVVLNYSGWDEYEQTVVNESVACIPEAVWMIGTIKDKGPQTEGKWGVIDLPKIEGGTYSVSNGGSTLAVNAKTPYPDAAKDFCKFAMTDKGLQASGFEKYGLYPSYIPSYDEGIFKKIDPFFGEQAIYDIFIENGKNVASIMISPNTQEASDSIGVAVSKIFLNGEDVEKTMKALQEELVTKFK